MKTIITSLMSVALSTFVLSSGASAADETKAKPVTLEGTATCAKCDLGTEKECATVLQVKEGDKTVTYNLAGKVDKEWHKKICKTPKEVKATGTVTDKDGKKTLDVTNIEMTKKMEKAK
ncbi:MAG: DUF6370 family protein [Luteolibacter sp.]